MSVFTRPAAPAKLSPRAFFDLGVHSSRHLMPMGAMRNDNEAPGIVGRAGRPSPRPAGTADEVAMRILAGLDAVGRERAARAVDAGLQRRTQAIKAYQQRRFEATYADLLADRRHAKAVRFFVDELQGPQDFAGREAQIASIVPTLAGMFPREIVDTVAALAALHALSESLDTDMGRSLRVGTLTRQRYVAAWRATGRAADRRRQIELTAAIGRRLDRHTRHPLLGASLFMMRGPALLAGQGELQHFLESGFDAFGSMRGAERFLSAIEQRESTLNAALFGAGSAEGDALDQLPQRS